MPKPEVQSEPRLMPEIEQEYGRLVSQSGQAQYQVHILSKDLERMNQQLESLNYEAAARKKLDEPVKAVTPEVVNAPIE